MAWVCLLLAVVSLFDAVVVNGQVFSEQPVDVVAKEGAGPATITCAVEQFDSGTQVLSFQRGTDIFSDDVSVRSDVLNGLGLNPENFFIHSDITTTARYTLYVYNLARNQEGQYRCLICGKTADSKCDTNNIIMESNIATLTIAHPPNPSTAQCSIQSNSGNTQVLLGESVTLACSSGSAMPAVNLTWMRNGQSVSANVSHGSVTSEATVKLTAQNADDGAVFSCQLAYLGIPSDPNDDISNDCSLPALNVVSEPVVTIEASEPILINEQAVFICSVSSLTSTFLAGAIEWTLPSSFGADRYTVSVSTNRSILTIAKVEIDDHGASLVCSAIDRDGITATVSKMLLIEGLPEPTQPNTGGTTALPPLPTPASFPTGALVAGLVVGLLVLVLLGAFVVWWCRRHPPKWSAKKKQAGATSHIPMNNASAFHGAPSKMSNHKNDQYSDRKDYPDGKANSDPDVIPREKRGGGAPDDVDPRKWWRETMPPTDAVHYEQSAVKNDYPTIRGMKMPFQDRSSPYMNMHDEERRGHNGYDPVNDRDYSYKHLDDRNFSDSGYREPRYDDGGYEDPQVKDHPYESAKFQDQMPSDYDYDNHAYEQSLNSQQEQEKNNPYDHYNDQYNDQYSDRYDDRYDDRPYDGYDDQRDQYSDRYDDHPEDRYDDRRDDGSYGQDEYNNHYSDHPTDPYDDQYGDRYKSYGHPDGQEEYNMPPAENEDYYLNYDQDERIPDGHSSSNDHYSAPYDDPDPYGPGYDGQPSDSYGYDQNYSGKHSYNDDDDLTNSQDTPSYV